MNIASWRSAGLIAAALAFMAIAPQVHAQGIASSTSSSQAVLATFPKPTDLTRHLTANGSIFAWQEIVVAPEVGGYQVAAVNVEIGDHVRRGQELARLSSDLLESQVKVERAGVAQAQALLDNALAARQRGETIATSGALSKADLDQLRANAATAQASLSSAQANLASAELRLKLTHVLAPDDGVITARAVNIGQVPQAGTELMRLLRKSRVEWRAEVPESDLQQIKPGQKVTLVSSSGKPVIGKVRSVAPTVQTSNRTGLIYVDVPYSADSRPGMFARGEIVTGSAQSLMVPLSAVLVQDGYSYLYVIKPAAAGKTDSTVERRRVTTGSLQNGQIEIAQGVQANERIVASGVAFLSDGQKVTVQSAP